MEIGKTSYSTQLVVVLIGLFILPGVDLSDQNMNRGNLAAKGGLVKTKLNIIVPDEGNEEFDFKQSVPQSSSSRNVGPYFDVNQTTIEVYAKLGQNVVLDCNVILLQGRTVSWLRRTGDRLRLLTVGNITYYDYPGVGLRFRYPNNWRLAIDKVALSDSGEWICQLSTHPVKTLVYHLKVIGDPQTVIHPESGAARYFYFADYNSYFNKLVVFLLVFSITTVHPLLYNT